MFWFFKRKLPEHLRTGIWGEKMAERTLRRAGLRILGRRVHIGRHDELDLVARDGNELVFVEVKTRGNESFGRPLDAVDRAKQKALCRAAAKYVTRLKQKPGSFRFDVVEVIGQPGDRHPEVRHIRCAFAMDHKYMTTW